MQQEYKKTNQVALQMTAKFKLAGLSTPSEPLIKNKIEQQMQQVSDRKEHLQKQVMLEK